MADVEEIAHLREQLANAQWDLAAIKAVWDALAQVTPQSRNDNVIPQVIASYRVPNIPIFTRGNLRT